MPLEYSPSHPDITQKVLAFKDAFLKLYKDAINHPEKAIRATRDSINDDWRENYDALAIYDPLSTDDGPYNLSNLTNITINIAQLTGGSSIYLRICDHFVAENKRQQYDQVTKSYQDRTNVLTFTYPREFYSAELMGYLNELAFNLTIPSKNDSIDKLPVVAKILEALTQPGPLSELISTTSVDEMTQDHTIPNFTENMPLIQQFKKDLLYDNGIENHMPNLNEIFTCLLILLRCVIVSN